MGKHRYSGMEKQLHEYNQGRQMSKRMDPLIPIFRCKYCGREFDSSLMASFCESLDEWEYCSGYKGEFLQKKHCDLKQIKDIRKKFRMEKKRE